MRAAILELLAIGATAAINVPPAQARELPFCMKGQGIADAHGDCSYATYEQCAASASGRYNYCDTNPFYVGRPAPAPAPQRRYPNRGY
jgi:hypothetical protein